MTERWFTPAEAEHLIVSRLGIGQEQIHRARNLLEAWLEQEVVRIIALQKAIEAVPQAGGGSDAKDRKRTIEQNVPISVGEWVGAILGQGDSSLWSIAELVTVGSPDGEPPSRIVYSGIRISRDDLEERLSLAGLDSPRSDAPKIGRRKGVGGFAHTDAPLVEDMLKLIERGEANSAWDAARLVSPRAQGAENNRQRRLTDAFLTRYPEKRG